MQNQSRAAEEGHSLYAENDLVSNITGQAQYADSSLVNPWGLVSDKTGRWWIADEGKGRVTLYSDSGIPLPALSPLVIRVPLIPGDVRDDSTPVGVVYNDTKDFELIPGTPAKLLLATLDGTFTGWSSNASKYSTVLLRDNSPEAVYTGAAIAQEIDNTLYLADFAEGRIETYGPDFSRIQLGTYAFNDPFLPDGFSPYNIQNINGMLFVTYAEYLQGKEYAAAGEGSGYVDEFDSGGTLVLRLQHGPWLNAPWGIALAPSGFGDFSGRLLVGNAGSGRIASFDSLTGEFLGYLPGGEGSPLEITGLHGLGFENNDIAGVGTKLYFTAGTDEGRKSIFGSISVSEVPAINRGGSTTVPGMNY